MAMNMKHKQSIQAVPQRGFSLVEIMVGLVIGLIGTIVIFQVFAISEGQKRTTTAGNDANQNGIFAQYTLERHIRMGGAGIVNAQNALGCGLNAFSNGVPVLPVPGSSLPAIFGGNGNLVAAPVLIQDGGGTNPDSIIVMYGNGSTAGIPISFTGFGPVASVSNTVSMVKGDIILAARQIQGTKPEAPAPCFIGEITDSSASDQVIMDTTGKHNSPIGIITQGQAYDGIDLGQPGLIGFGISSLANNRFELVSYDFLSGGALAPVADNIVNLQALYGVDDGSGVGTGTIAEDSNIDAWVPATGNWSYANLTNGSAAASVRLRRIKAVQLAVVARSALPEKPDNTGKQVTQISPVLFSGGTNALTIPIINTPLADYRYKIFETTIPLRNMLIQQCLYEDRQRGLCNP
jgi:type IV pilus assembly protein PilW